MAYFNSKTATVTVHDFKSLLAAWRTFGGNSLLGGIVMDGRITEEQRQSLPKELSAICQFI